MQIGIRDKWVESHANAASKDSPGTRERSVRCRAVEEAEGSNGFFRPDAGAAGGVDLYPGLTLVPQLEI
jgi:hypothetical protein